MKRVFRQTASKRPKIMKRVNYIYSNCIEGLTFRAEADLLVESGACVTRYQKERERGGKRGGSLKREGGEREKEEK